MDVIIIGGGVAGLSAALYLGRFRYKVLVIDGQKPANRFSHASHSFFTRDGESPAELLAIGREQLQQYDTVQLQVGEVTEIIKEGDQLSVALADGSRYQTRKVLLATGIKDKLPDFMGIEAFWGSSVFPCPYCDGWEQRDQPVAVVANGDGAIHLAKLMRLLTDDLVICTDGTAAFDASMWAALQARGIRVIETPITAFEGEGSQLRQIVFADGTTLTRKAAFIRSEMSQHSPFAAQLGCVMTEQGLVQIDGMGRTSVPGVYAAGDMASGPRQVIIASYQGAMAGISINADMLAAEH